MNFDEEYDLSGLSKDDLGFAWRAISVRRLQWDNLLWQIPLLSVTGEAFLFLIILSDKTSYFSRNLSSILSMLVSTASLHLFARQRASELHDSYFLEAIEKRYLGFSLHGEKFMESRATFVKHELRSKSKRWKVFELRSRSKWNIFDFSVQKLNGSRAYPFWMVVFFAFLITALLCLILNNTDSGIFSTDHFTGWHYRSFR